MATQNFEANNKFLKEDNEFQAILENSCYLPCASKKKETNFRYFHVNSHHALGL